MSDSNRILIRNAREQDIPAVAEIAAEAFTADGTAEKPETLQRRLTAFPNGFIILVAENEIAAYGCSEKRLDEHPSVSHQPDGRVFWITAIAARRKYRGKGYRLLVLDRLIETAHLEGCKKLIVETARDQDLYLQRGFTSIRNRAERGMSLDLMSLDLKPIRMNP